MNAVQPINKTRLHSRFAPSSLKRILHCPPSLLLSEARVGPEPTTSIWAAEGTVAHMLVESMLAEPGDTDAKTIKLNDVIPVPPHMIRVDEDMFIAAYVFSDFIKSLRDNSAGTVWLERVVHLDEVVGADALCYGHLDAAVMDWVNGILHIADFKYGRGVVVEVKDNAQLYAYAVGAMFSLLTHDQRADLKAIRLHVVQPRLGDAGLHSLTLTPMQLAEWVEGDLYPVVRAIVDGTLPDDAPLIPGDHCQFCPVMMECPALHARAQSMAKHVFQNAEHTLPLMTNDDLARILDQAELIEPWLVKVKELALERMRMGGAVPGWKLVPKRGHRVWNEDEAETTKRITQEIDGVKLADIMQTKLRTPAQIEKIIPAKARDTFRAMWRMESPGVTIAPDSDPRRTLLPEASVLFDKTETSD